MSHARSFSRKTAIIAAPAMHRTILRSFRDSPVTRLAKPMDTAHQMRLLLLGSPGSGKGTQSSRIQHEFHATALSSGDLLRRSIAAGTEVGKIAAGQMAKGALVSDDIVISLVIDELQKYREKNWILDGFPRTLRQAETLDENLLGTSQPLNIVINLDVPEEVILQRIMDRWVHIPSGRVYNLSYNPPKVAGYDDITGEPLSKRPDDNPETFKVRLAQHRAQTEPLLEYYDKQNLLVNLSGKTSDELYPKIERELESRFQCDPAYREEIHILELAKGHLKRQHIPEQKSAVEGA